MAQISILIADADHYLRDMMHRVISMQEDMVVIDEARTAEELEVKVRALHPQVLLLDMAIPCRGSQSATELIALASDYSRVIALSLQPDEVYLRAAYQAGAMGFQVKTAPADKLLRSIRLAARCDRRSYCPWPPPQNAFDRRSPFDPRSQKKVKL